MKDKMMNRTGKTEAEKYRSSKMDGPSKVGKDSLRKVSHKPTEMKGGMNSDKGGMDGMRKSK